MNQTYKRNYIFILFKKNVTNNIEELESYFNESQIDWMLIHLNAGICVNQNFQFYQI